MSLFPSLLLSAALAGCSDGRTPVWKPSAHEQCGDKVVQPPEACDDGNDATGDGCHGCDAVVSLAAGEQHTCALISNGTVKCWGRNEWHQAGAADTSGPVELTAGLEALALAGRAMSIACGDEHCCAALESGRVQCWGHNDVRQLGPDAAEGNSRAAKLVALPSPPRGLALGADHTCTLAEDSSVRCWGRRAPAIMSDGKPVGTQWFDTSRWERPLDLDAPMKAIASRRTVTCGITSDDGVKCWGSIRECRGGSMISGPNCSDNFSKRGTRLTALSLGKAHAVAIAVTDIGPCVLLDDGTVKCTTPKMLEQAFQGRGDEEPFGEEWQAVALGSEKPTAIAGGADFVCAGYADGHVSCWGSACPACPSVPTHGARAPHRVELGAAVKQLTAGTFHVCALLAGGTVRCFGRNNESGELGRGKGAASYEPGPPLSLP